MRRLFENLPEDLQNPRRLTKSHKTLRDYIRKNELCFLFGHIELVVISQGIRITFVFDSSLGIFLHLNLNFESYLVNSL